MPIFYRGAGIGTYWHRNDARLSGFTPHFPGANRSVARVMNHISRGTTQSAYVSLTLSYEVALTYAITWSTPAPTASSPAYVYEIDIPEPPPAGALIVDPVVIPRACVSGRHDVY